MNKPLLTDSCKRHLATIGERANGRIGITTKMAIQWQAHPRETGDIALQAYPPEDGGDLRRIPSRKRRKLSNGTKVAVPTFMANGDHPFFIQGDESRAVALAHGLQTPSGRHTWPFGCRSLLPTRRAAVPARPPSRQPRLPSKSR